MKQERNVDSMIKILKRIKESVEPGYILQEPIDKYESYQIYLMKDAKLLGCNIKGTMDGLDIVTNILITNDGHDFLDSLTDENVSKEVRKEVEKKGKTLSDIALPVLIQITYDASKLVYNNIS